MYWSLRLSGSVDHGVSTTCSRRHVAAATARDRERRPVQERAGASPRPSGRTSRVTRRSELLLNFCANNYLGLADHPEVVRAAHEALDRWGYGLASVRFICGTQQLHKELEAKLAQFLGTEDTILYSSCFDANGGLFETLLGAEDAVISDELNHASIIDGIRLCKAQRLPLQEQRHGRPGGEAAARPGRAAFRLIATDGVFSMDGMHRQPAGHLRPGRQATRRW